MKKSIRKGTNCKDCMECQSPSLFRVNSELEDGEAVITAFTPCLQFLGND